jgi:hypothetical protein
MTQTTRRRRYRGRDMTSEQIEAVDNIGQTLLALTAQLVLLCSEPEVFRFGPDTVEKLMGAYSNTRFMLGAAAVAPVPLTKEEV